MLLELSKLQNKYSLEGKFLFVNMHSQNINYNCIIRKKILNFDSVVIFQQFCNKRKAHQNKHWESNVCLIRKLFNFSIGWV